MALFFWYISKQALQLTNLSTGLDNLSSVTGTAKLGYAGRIGLHHLLLIKKRGGSSMDPSYVHEKFFKAKIVALPISY